MTKRNVKGGLQIPRALIFATQKDIFLLFCLCLDHKSFGKNTMQEEHSVGDMCGMRGNFEGKVSRRHNYHLALHSLYFRPRIFLLLLFLKQNSFRVFILQIRVFFSGVLVTNSCKMRLIALPCLSVHIQNLRTFEHIFIKCRLHVSVAKIYEHIIILVKI